MKKIRFLLFTLFCINSAALPLFANYNSRQTTAFAHYDTPSIHQRDYMRAEKFLRGMGNLLGCWLEIPRNIRNVREEKGQLKGHTLGLLQGIAWTGGRFVTGVYEMLTFAIPRPEKFRPVLVPEMVTPGSRKTPYTPVEKPEEKPAVPAAAPAEEQATDTATPPEPSAAEGNTAVPPAPSKLFAEKPAA